MPIINGIGIDDPVPSIAGQELGNLLILGGGKCVWEDYLEARALFGGKGSYHIMCVNDIALQFKAEPIQHAVSLHKRILPAIKGVRAEKGMLEPVTTHCHKPGPGVEERWSICNVGGTSGMFATKIAIVMGYKKIIVCGVPMDNNGHYFDPLNINDNNSTTFKGSSNIVAWRELGETKIAKHRVRSMSGRTRATLGEPTKEWVNGNN